VALVGHNGSGKTTFLRMMAALLEPTSGSVTIHGHPAGTQPARAAVSFCGDPPTFYDDLSLWEHLEFMARMHGRDEPDQLAADLLGELGLYERADDLPNRFSRGLRQKAALAVSFIRPFGLLLVDEPFVGLDLAGRDVLLDLLDRATDDGATVVVATHGLSFLQRVDCAIVLADGVLVHDGAADHPAVETSLRGGH
jgi:ABC-type multidrug transport system ATPase subunit